MNQEQEQDQLTIVCISDTHCHFVELPAGDILVHCGDFSNSGQEKEIDDFIQWISKQPFQHKIVIAGNHEVSLDPVYTDHLKNRFHRYSNFDEKALLQRLKDSCHYLENSSITVEGYKFWGSPYSLEFCNWGFSLQPQDADKFWEQIDKDSEIIITHGPPYFYGDKINDGTRVGDRDLLNAVKQIRPKLHIFGHIHEGYGEYQEDGGFYDDRGIKFINCSISTNIFLPKNAPIVVKVPKKQ